jgi:hypothetical protein
LPYYPSIVSIIYLSSLVVGEVKKPIIAMGCQTRNNQLLKEFGGIPITTKVIYLSSIN